LEFSKPFYKKVLSGFKGETLVVFLPKRHTVRPEAKKGGSFGG
jgi:hypothetical protein